jgi:hypothetical protein
MTRRSSPAVSPVTRAAALSVAIACTLTEVGAQESPLRGTVTASASRLPLGGAVLSVGGTALRTESGDDGRFLLARVPRGATWLHVRRIGFRPDSVRLAAAGDGFAEPALALDALAVTLRPMVVVSSREVSGPMAGFYRRRQSGSGRFFTRDEIERRNPQRLSDLFRNIPGIRIQPRGMMNSVRVRGSRCAPFVWLDGAPLSAMEFDLDAVDPKSFDGIEVYSGPASVPVEYQGNRAASSSCGTILLWSRRGEPRAAKPRAAQGPSAAAQIAALVERREVFTDADVDERARMDSTRIVLPSYPDRLFDAGLSGRLLAEFVVSAAGEVELGTFNVVTTTHRELVDPVRDALRTQKFVAARRQGAAVAQVVLQPFVFSPDSVVRRRED